MYGSPYTRILHFCRPSSLPKLPSRLLPGQALSLSSSLSLSSLLSLSLSKPLSFSLFFSSKRWRETIGATGRLQRARAGPATSEGAEEVVASLVRRGVTSFAGDGGAWRGREGTPSYSHLRPPWTVILGTSKFHSISSSYWCPPFVTKVAGLLNTLFEANCQNFDCWSAKRDLIFR